MTRMERKRRRQWIAVYLILAAAIITLAAVIVWAEPWKKQAVERVPHEPPYPVFEEIAAQVATDNPVRDYYREDVPLDRYTQETLWNACQEWNVPYELALAVCWRETNFRDLVTTNDTGTYYGMMAVQRESAKWYMEQCGIEYLNSIEDRLRVGCCILGSYLEEYPTAAALMCYNAGQGAAMSQWAVGVENTTYTLDVIGYMEELMA